ncbi:hypothetical protein ACFQ3Z_07360 [Streptomyces nogalater]
MKPKDRTGRPAARSALHPHAAGPAAGEPGTAHLATHTVPLDEAPRAYEMVKARSDGCVRAVIRPGD